MRAELRRELEEAAVRLALPDWELRADDVITLRVYHDEGYFYSEYTCEDAATKIEVHVMRSGRSTLDPTMAYDRQLFRFAEYANGEAADFVNKLLTGDAP